MKKGACPSCGLRFKKGRLVYLFEKGALERKIVCFTCAEHAIALVVPETVKDARALLKPFAEHMARLAHVYRLSGQDGLAHGYEHAAGMLEDGRAVSPATSPAAIPELAPKGDRGKRPSSPAADDDGPDPRAKANGARETHPCEQAILSALRSRAGGPLSRAECAFIAGYSPESGGYSKALGHLRAIGWITGSSQALSITAEGTRHASWTPLPTGERLLEVWAEKAGTCAGALLVTSVRAYPEELTRERLALESGGYSPESGGFSKALGHLRGLSLFKGLRPSDEFMSAIAMGRKS